MPESSPALHMVQLVLDGYDLQRSAQRQRLSKDSADHGYLLHGHLSALFGDLQPQPFHSHSLQRDVEVLGYCQSDHTALLEQARAFAEPMVLGSIKRLESKIMPTTWRPEQRLAFEVRVCPVVRLSSAVAGFKAGAELDAFQAARLRGDHDSGRAEIYRQWFERRLDDAARLNNFHMKRLRSTQLHRRPQRNADRAQRRHGKQLQRPDAWLSGELQITDTDAFQQLLARGIGRHRAFGFGMLRLRPPRRHGATE